MRLSASFLFSFALLTSLLSCSARVPTTLSPSPPSHPDHTSIYLHSQTIDTRIEKDIQKLVDEGSDFASHIQYLVHVSGSVDSKYVRLLTEKVEEWSGSVINYIPHNTFLITCDLRCAGDLYEFPRVSWVGPYTSSMKLSPFFTRQSKRAQLSQEMTSFGMTVACVAAPRAMRRRGMNYDDIASVAWRWQDEISTKFEGENKGARSAGSLGLVVKPSAHDRVRVTISNANLNIVSQVAEWLAAQPESHWIEPTLQPKAFNLYSRSVIQTGVDDVGNNWAWDHGLDGAGEVVGIGDTGLNMNHCFFYDPNNIVPLNTTNFNHRKVVSYFALQDTVDFDNGHGTHTSGSIAGYPSDSASPLSAYGGQAPAAKLAFIDIMKGNNFGNVLSVPMDLNDYFSLTYNATARIHSDSWGSSSYPYYNTVAQDIDEFSYSHTDFLNVRAIGNTGANGYSTLSAECVSKNSLCVGASLSTVTAFENAPDNTDFQHVIAELSAQLCAQGLAGRLNLTCDANNSTELNVTICCDNPGLQTLCCRQFIQDLTDARAPQVSVDDVAVFSSRGPTVDSRIKPDIVGPGAPVYSSRSLVSQPPNYCDSSSVFDSPSTAAVFVVEGSSQATALVAGAAALVRQYFRNGYQTSGAQNATGGFSPSGALIKATVINSADHLNASVYDPETFVESYSLSSDYTYSTEYSYSQGFGRVNLNNVLWFGDSDFNFFTSSNASGDQIVNTGEFHSYCFAADTSRPFKATLVWTDPPASPSSFFSLVNDLDLYVQDSQWLYYGNERIAATDTYTTDTVNNVEQVTMRQINGTIRIFVYGAYVPLGPQAYSLVVSGKFEQIVCSDCIYDSNNVTQIGCTVSHGVGVRTCMPNGFFSDCDVTDCDSGYVTGSMLNRNGCTPIISLTLYSVAIMVAIALIVICIVLGMCSRVGKGRWKEIKSDPEEPKALSTVMLIIKLAQPEGGLILAGTVLALFGVGLSLIVPLISANIFDVLYSSEGYSSRRNDINVSIGILAAVTIGIVFFEFLQGTVLALAGHRLVARLRISLFINIVSQEMAFFDQRSTGEIMSRLATDVGFLRNILSQSMPTIVANSAQFCGGVVMMFIISWKLTLVVLAPLPIMTVCFKYYGGYINSISVKMQDALAEAASAAAETLFNVRTVRWMAGEAKEGSRFSTLIYRAYDISRRLTISNGFYGAATGVTSYLFTLVLLAYGSYLVLEGDLSPALLIAFSLFVPFVNDAVTHLSNLYTEFQGSMGASKRFFELIERQPQIDLNKGNKLARVKGSISLQGVTFRYPARPDALVLNDLTLDFTPGTITALVGPSGSGKSTVLAMIGRIYDPESGTVNIDGYDVKTLDCTNIHKQIGVVTQEPSLFSGSIYDNVAYTNENATKGEIIEACRKAHAHEFITQFPDGYETQLGDRGTQLSGGQKQRIAIARAILMNPVVLLLDEATSELDVESEHLVQKALEAVMRNKTVVVVAHRLSTVLSADVIAVIDEGKVVEKGTHEELLSKKGTYFEYVERQWSKVGGMPDIATKEIQPVAANDNANRRLSHRVSQLQLALGSEGATGSSSSSPSPQPAAWAPRTVTVKKGATSTIWRTGTRQERKDIDEDDLKKKLVEKSIKKIRADTRTVAYKGPRL